MVYSIYIDQKFAIENGLTITQVCCLSSCISLQLWSDKITIDNVVWYKFSEDKMSQDFPLLFSVPKRCYKNIAELEKLGYVKVIKIKDSKYITTTEKCSFWGREKSSPKSDCESENGPDLVRKRTEIGPKTDSILYTNILTNNINTNNKESSYEDKKEEDIFSSIKDMWNCTIASHKSTVRKCRVMNDSLMKKIRAKMKDISQCGDWRVILQDIFDKICSDSFCNGNNDNGWRASLEYVFSKNNKGSDVWVTYYERETSSSAPPINQATAQKKREMIFSGFDERFKEINEHTLREGN